MSLNVIVTSTDLFPLCDKLKQHGEDYMYFFPYGKDKMFSVFDFCRRVKADRCIIPINKAIMLPCGRAIKEITYKKAAEFEDIFPKSIVKRAEKDNLEVVFWDTGSFMTTTVRNFIEHT